MATATVKLTPSNYGKPYAIDSSTIDYMYDVTFSAATDTYATGGIVMNLTAGGNLSNSTQLPVSVNVFQRNVLAATPNVYKFVWGTTQANGLLQCFEGITEKTNAQAMNAGGNQNGDTIKAIVRFPRY